MKRRNLFFNFVFSFLGGLLLSEPITPNIMIALLLITMGIFVVNAKTRKAFSIVHPGRNV